MNHETAVAMAVVLAVIIITVLYGLISGGLGVGEQGVGNVTERAEDDDTGQDLDFTSSSGNPNEAPRSIYVEGGKSI